MSSSRDDNPTVLRRVGGVSPDSRRPWFARLYLIGGQLDIEVTNFTKDGLQMDIEVGLKRREIGLIEWGGPEPA